MGAAPWSHEAVDERSRDAVVAPHAVVEVAHDIQVCVRAECEMRRVREPGGEHTLRDAGRAVEAEHFVGPGGGEEIAARTERDAIHEIRGTAAREDADERPGGAVEAGHVVVHPVGDIQVAVGPEAQTVRIQTRGRGEDVDEGARRTIETWSPLKPPPLANTSMKAPVAPS